MKVLGDTIASYHRSLHARATAGELPLPCSLQDALVDEVSFRAVDLRQDIVHFLSSTKTIIMNAFALAARTFTCSASTLFFLGHFDFSMKFHKQNVLRLKNNLYLCSTKPEAGRVSPPFGTLKDDSENRYLYFPNPKENCELHRASGFCFLLSLRFSEFSSCHLLTLQRYENFLKYANKIRIIFVKSCKNFCRGK